MAVLALESSSFPPESLLDYVASRCGVDPKDYMSWWRLPIPWLDLYRSFQGL